MIRDDAAQHFYITRATWGFSDRNTYSVPVLCLAVETEEQRSIFPEEDGWSHSPRWHIDVWSRGLRPEMLQAGCVIRIPDSHDGFTGVVYTTFHYDEHEGTMDNKISVAERCDDTLRLAIEGYIRHDFASMRSTRITIDATFARLSPCESIGVGYFRESLPPHEPPNGARSGGNRRGPWTSPGSSAELWRP